MSTWKEQIDRQARLLVQEIASLNQRLDPTGSSASIEKLYGILERIYTEDFHLADLYDNSDLVFRLGGGAFEEQPRLQLVTSILDNVSHQVTDLTKVILGKWAEGRVTPSSLDLALSGVARGSLVFGLVAELSSSHSMQPLTGEADTLFLSTREALDAIDTAAHIVENDDEQIELEAVSERFDDPSIRDATLLALQRLSPSGRRGIDTLAISGQSGVKPATLNATHRKAIRESLIKPIIHGEKIRLVGYIREIDLDAHRFDLRGIDDEQIRDVRCAYRNLESVRAKDLLGSYAQVDGLVERTTDGVPRLLSVLDINIHRQAPDDVYQVDESSPPLPLLKN